jgi:hypothetical protein
VGRKAGRPPDHGRARRHRFIYDAAWLADPNARPISRSLPKREEPYNRREARPLFAGLLPDETDVRLSLAGAQTKLPVVLVDDRVALPGPGQPTTHNLKPSLPQYPATTENEAFVMQLAASIGLSVAPVKPCRIEDKTYLLVTRYDREIDASGRVHACIRKISARRSASRRNANMPPKAAPPSMPVLPCCVRRPDALPLIRCASWMRCCSILWLVMPMRTARISACCTEPGKMLAEEIDPSTAKQEKRLLAEVNATDRAPDRPPGNRSIVRGPDLLPLEFVRQSGSRATTFFVFFAATAWTWIVPSRIEGSFHRSIAISE